MTAIAGAGLARAYLNPVGVRRDPTPALVDGGDGNRDIRRHLDLERAVRLDFCIAENLLHLEFGLADRLARNAGLGWERPGDADETRRTLRRRGPGRVFQSGK